MELDQLRMNGPPDEEAVFRRLGSEEMRGKASRGNEGDVGFYGTAFHLKNPTPPGAAQARDPIRLYKEQMKPHPPQHTHGRARRKHGGDQGHPKEAESHPEEAERRKKDPMKETDLVLDVLDDDDDDV